MTRTDKPEEPVAEALLYPHLPPIPLESISLRRLECIHQLRFAAKMEEWGETLWAAGVSGGGD